MKISNASKKVLASALSLAMVAAFSPATAAFATPDHDTNNSASQEVAHTMDHGTVTKAATCNEPGYVTYKCIEDGCDYSYVQVIPATGKHSYSVFADASVDGEDGVVDGVDWSAFSNGSGTATAYFKCANSGEVESVALNTSSKWAQDKGEISSKVTKDPTFGETGVLTYTLKAELDGVKVESTYAAPIVVINFKTASIVATDNYGTVKLNVYGQDDKLATTVKADVKTSVKTEADCATKLVTTYTATFAAVPGVSADSIKSALVGGTIGNTTLDASDITANADGSVVVKFDVEGQEDASKHVVKVKQVSYNGYAISADDGSLANGTASTATSMWTVTAEKGETCPDKDFKGYTDVEPTKVDKQQVGDVWVYTVTFGGGNTYTFYAGEHKVAYTLSTEWAIDTEGHCTGTKVYAIDATAQAIDGMVNNKGEIADYNKKDVIPIDAATCDSSSEKIVPATCEAAGSYTHTFKVSKDAANAAIAAARSEASVNYITADYSDTKSGVIAQLPKPADHYYYVAGSDISWNSTNTSAFATVKCSGSNTTSEDDDLSVVRLNSTDITTSTYAGATSDNRKFSAAGIKYSAKFTTDLSVDQTKSPNFVRNSDGSYSHVKTVEKATAAFAGALDSQTNLPSTAEATNVNNWTVTVGTDPVDSKKYTPTKVELASGSATAATCKDGATVTYNVTLADGSVYAYAFNAEKTSEHSYEIAYYTVDGDKATAHFKCSVCGKTKEIGGSRFNGGDYSVVTFPDGTKVNVYKNTTDVAQDNWNAPTFKFYTGIEDGVIYVGATATFTSQDGSKVVYADCDVTLVDAKTNTYKATVVSSEVPAGYTGADSTLTTTKVVKLHEGHAVNKIKTVKATASAAGYIKYFCNNDNMTYRVVIAKDNMKLAKKTKTFKYAKVKKAAKKVTIKVKNAKGKVSYKVAAKAKKAGVSVTAKGVVKVKKGTAKGTYKVTVTSKATSQYKANTKTFKVKVK